MSYLALSASAFLPSVSVVRTCLMPYANEGTIGSGAEAEQMKFSRTLCNCRGDVLGDSQSYIVRRRQPAAATASLASLRSTATHNSTVVGAIVCRKDGAGWGRDDSEQSTNAVCSSPLD